MTKELTGFVISAASPYFAYREKEGYLCNRSESGLSKATAGRARWLPFQKNLLKSILSFIPHIYSVCTYYVSDTVLVNKTKSLALHTLYF